MLVKSASAKRGENHILVTVILIVQQVFVLMSKITFQCTEGPAWLESSWSDLGHVKIHLLPVNLIKSQLFIERSDFRRRNSSKLHRKKNSQTLPLLIHGQPTNIFMEVQRFSTTALKSDIKTSILFEPNEHNSQLEMC